MTEIDTVGLDLAKNVCVAFGASSIQVHGADGSGRAILGEKLRRDQARLSSVVAALRRGDGSLRQRSRLDLQAGAYPARLREARKRWGEPPGGIDVPRWRVLRITPLACREKQGSRSTLAF